MAKEKKKKKEKTSVILPKAWQSVKHRNETAQARSNYEDTWKAITTILLILAIAFVLLGGVSQTGIIKFIFNWSSNAGEKISNWIEGGSIVTNEDGIYYDPSGQQGEKIKNDDVDISAGTDVDPNKPSDDDSDDSDDSSQSDSGNDSEVQNE